MRGNIFHNPVSLLSFLLVTFKAKSFYIITNSSLPMHCLCYKTQMQQGIKSDYSPSPPFPIPLNSLQVTTINSLVYILCCPFPCFLNPLLSPTRSCFMNYHLYCSTSCFLHLAMYLGSLPLVLCILSPHYFALLHSTPEYIWSTITHPSHKTHSTPLC